MALAEFEPTQLPLVLCLFLMPSHSPLPLSLPLPSLLTPFSLLSAIPTIPTPFVPLPLAPCPIVLWSALSLPPPFAQHYPCAHSFPPNGLLFPACTRH